MNKHALSSAIHSTPRQAAYALASMLSLAGLLLLGGCNKGPAPSAPTADSATTAQSASARPARSGRRTCSSSSIRAGACPCSCYDRRGTPAGGSRTSASAQGIHRARGHCPGGHHRADDQC